MTDRAMTQQDREALAALQRDAAMDRAQEGAKTVARLASVHFRECLRQKGPDGKALYSRAEAVALTAAFTSSVATMQGKG